MSLKASAFFAAPIIVNNTDTNLFHHPKLTQFLQLEIPRLVFHHYVAQQTFFGYQSEIKSVRFSVTDPNLFIWRCNRFLKVNLEFIYISI